MNIARLLFPVKVLGPGNRLGIWMTGCSHYCKGCSNPELWEKKPDFEITGSQLEDTLEKFFPMDQIEGVTITGGDPFYSPEDLLELLTILKNYSNDILVYTGFTIEELKKMKNRAVSRCLRGISVLIDGPYIQERNNGCPLRGSDNQNIYFIDGSIRQKYELYLKEPNRIQNFLSRDGIISVGIHEPDFASEITKEAIKAGIIVNE